MTDIGQMYKNKNASLNIRLTLKRCIKVIMSLKHMTDTEQMPQSRLIFSQSDYLIQIIDTNSHTKLQTVQIKISWLQKPTDPDLHCLQSQGKSGSADLGLNSFYSIEKLTLFS